MANRKLLVIAIERDSPDLDQQHFHSQILDVDQALTIIGLQNLDGESSFMSHIERLKSKV